MTTVPDPKEQVGQRHWEDSECGLSWLEDRWVYELNKRCFNISQSPAKALPNLLWWMWGFFLAECLRFVNRSFSLPAAFQVVSIHDLHVWCMGSADVFTTAHIVVAWKMELPLTHLSCAKQNYTSSFFGQWTSQNWKILNRNDHSWLWLIATISKKISWQFRPY